MIIFLKIASSQDSCDQMKFDVTLTKFFNQAEEKGLDIGLYGHIISYVDCVSKHVSYNEILYIVACALFCILYTY